LATSTNDSLLARVSFASMLITDTATRADLRGTLNQGAYLRLGLQVRHNMPGDGGWGH
jgi:hypothetical protein